MLCNTSPDCYIQPMTLPESTRRSKHFPLSRLFPNMVTIAGLCCGASAIRFAMLEKWEISVTFIVIAAVIDGMDGMIARMLRATSNFGAQLDSLSDIIAFGVAPALVIYMWALEDIRRLGWAVALFYIVCCALRLARFNAAINDQQDRKLSRQFFVGVPSPAGALLALLPLILSFHDIMLFGSERSFAAIHLAFVAMLMASRVPTFAAKNIRITYDMVLPVMLCAGLIVALFMIAPWMTLAGACVLYLCTLPISTLKYYKLKRENDAARASD